MLQIDNILVPVFFHVIAFGPASKSFSQKASSSITRRGLCVISAIIQGNVHPLIKIMDIDNPRYIGCMYEVSLFNVAPLATTDVQLSRSCTNLHNTSFNSLNTEFSK